MMIQYIGKSVRISNARAMATRSASEKRSREPWLRPRGSGRGGASMLIATGTHLLLAVCPLAASAAGGTHSGAHIEPARNHQEHQQQNPERGRVAGIGIEESVLVDQGGEHLARIGRTACRHHLHDREVHETADPG